MMYEPAGYRFPSAVNSADALNISTSPMWRISASFSAVGRSCWAVSPAGITYSVRIASLSERDLIARHLIAVVQPVFPIIRPQAQHRHRRAEHVVGLIPASTRRRATGSGSRSRAVGRSRRSRAGGQLRRRDRHGVASRLLAVSVRMETMLWKQGVDRMPPFHQFEYCEKPSAPVFPSCSAAPEYRRRAS